MRSHLWQYVLNVEGQPVSGATVSIYTDSTLAELVTVYTTRTGSSTTSTITTNNEGYFECWVGDQTETFGYPSNNPFSLLIYSDTITARQIDDIHLHFSPPRMYAETLTDTWVSGAAYMHSIEHKLNTMYPLVQMWKNTKLVTDNSIICYTTGLDTITLSAATDPSETVRVLVIGNDT